MSRELRAGPLIARLFRDFLSRYTSELLAIAVVLASVAGFATLYVWIVKEATDGLSSVDAGALFWAPAAIIAATAGRALAIWAQALLTQGLGQKILRDIQGAMFGKVVRADFERYSRESSGHLVSRLTNDINVVSESLVRGAQAVMRDALTLVGLLVSMLLLDWVLTLLIIGLFALVGPMLSRIAKRARRQTEAQQQTFGKLTSVLSEIFSSPRFVKTYALEASQSARAEAVFEERRKVAMTLVRNRSGVDPLLEVVGGLALAALFYVAGLRIASGVTTVGSLLAMITAVAAASPSARALGTFNTVFNEGVAALGRIFALLDEPDRVADAPGAPPLNVAGGRIAFDDVSFAYGAAPALRHVSLEIAAGETVAFVGGSGAGKTTIFNLIPRLFDPTEGAIYVDGQDIRSCTIGSLRSAVALVSQDIVLFDDTVRANIAFGRTGASQSEIEEAARAAAAHAFISALPQGYDTRVGERGANLSGGERQRIALARAFLKDAPILLLDEATSALDAASEAIVQDALKRLSAGRTTLIIAHRLSTVRDADRIFVMEAGQVVESGSHEALMAQNGRYAALARLQFEPA